MVSADWFCFVNLPSLPLSRDYVIGNYGAAIDYAKTQPSYAESTLRFVVVVTVLASEIQNKSIVMRKRHQTGHFGVCWKIKLFGSDALPVMENL